MAQLMDQPNNMRKLILTGTYAQYRDWLVLNKANERAAVCIHRAEQFRHCDPEHDEVVLADGYADNPAYMTPEYLQFTQSPSCSLAVA